MVMALKRSLSNPATLLVFIRTLRRTMHAVELSCHKKLADFKIGTDGILASPLLAQRHTLAARGDAAEPYEPMLAF
jgi:hypothetical protein